MTKYELSLSPDYVPHWNLQDALRELFQNAIDQETTNPDNTASFDYDGETLKICNKYSSLSAKTLLLGASSKRDDETTIGKFGEGYKIAALVLTRLGKTFRIETLNEVWTFRFSKSKKYDSTILVCEVSTGGIFMRNSSKPDLSMIVDNITQEEFEELGLHNLHVRQPIAKIETPKGAILLQPDYAGKIFVNGLFICDTSTNKSISTYRMGYDFRPECIKLDRDRKLVTDGDIKWLASQMWASGDSKYADSCALISSPLEAANSDPLNYKHLLKQLVQCNAPDIQYLQYQSHSTEMKEVCEDVHAEFLREHGQNAVPVYSNDELEELQKDKSIKPVIVTDTANALMRRSSSFSYSAPLRLSTKDRLQLWFDTYCDGLPTEGVDSFNEIMEEL